MGMFLPHLHDIGFFPAGSDVTGFANFPVNKRRTIALEVVEMLSGDTPPSETLTTDGSVRTMLDCMGQALSLPIEDHGIIRPVIQLYRQWLLGKNRPPLMTLSHEEDMLKQLSVVFELRFGGLNASMNADIHAELCIIALQTFVEASRAGKLSSLWVLSVKVLLGITDYVIRDEIEAPNNYLGDRLSPRVLSVFFEVLFASGTRDEQIWITLPQLAQKWRHRAALVYQWAHLSWTLSGKLIRIIYGPACGSDLFTMEDGEGKMVHLVIEDDFTIFFLLGDFETIPDQNNYLQALRGVGRIVDLFLHIGGSKDSLYVDGNSILYTTGQHLFKAINHFREYRFDSGKAEAFQILMKIFEEKRDSPFATTFLACFYHGLQQALVKNVYLVGIILNCTKSLFQLELPGSHILIPVYIQSIQYQHNCDKTMEGLSVSLIELKLSCVRVLCYFACLPSHMYRSHQQLINLDTPDSAAAAAAGHLTKALGAADEFLVIIPQVVLDAMRSNHPQDLQITVACLWLGFVFLLETIDMPQCASFLSQYVNLVLNRIVSATSGWELQAISSGLRALTHLAEYQNSSAMVHADLGNAVLLNICKLIENHCTIENRKECSDEILIASMETVLAWIINDTQSLITKDTRAPIWQRIFDVFSTVAYGKSGMEVPKYVVPSTKAKDAAECAIEQLLCKTSNFTAPSVAFQEADYLEQENLSIKNASCFVAGNSIISLITHPRNEASSFIKIAAFVRSVAGKFFWETQIHTSAYDSMFACSNSATKVSTQSAAAPATLAVQSVPKSDDRTSAISLKLKNCFGTTAQQSLFVSLLDVAHKQEEKKTDKGQPSANSRHSPQKHQHQHHHQQLPQQQAHRLTPLSPHLAQQSRNLPPLSLAHVHGTSPPSQDSPVPGSHQDLTAVRIFLSNLGLISQPPPSLAPRPPSPILRHRNISSSHNPTSPSASPLPSSPTASTSSMLPPSAQPLASALSHANFRAIDLHTNTFEYLFGLLDELRERECYEIAVLFIPSKFPLSQPDSLFDITEGSSKFEEFVQAIGWKVRLAEHSGYAGQVGIGLSPDSTECSCYYANNSVERYRVSTYLARYRKMALSLASLARESEEPASRVQPTDHKFFDLDNSLPQSNKSTLSSPPRFATPDQTIVLDQLKEKSKRGSFKKSMSVSGGLGYTTIPNRDMKSSGTSRQSVQNAFKKTTFSDEENNVNTLASRKKLLTAPKVIVIWSEGIRSANCATNITTNANSANTKLNNNGNSNSLPQYIGSRALISIIVFPLKSGLFHIKIVKKPTVLLGPLVDGMVVGSQLLPQLVRMTAINACRALNDPDSPKPGLVRKNVIEELTKPVKDLSFYQFYAPHFSSGVK